ncbi:MAG: MarR family transcriptional regulator [Deltaproteobacteria bacterium]|nr:MarR family transcriptional regulator [Deltaproteobacteria bacterium]
MTSDNNGPTAEKGKILHDLFREVFALQAALVSVMDKAHELSGLTTPQRRIMNVIRQKKAATVPEIASLLGVSRQFVQTVCNKMVSLDYVEFKDNPRHKRSHLVALTRAGDVKFDSAHRNENEMIGRTIPDISLEKAEEARDLLTIIRESLDISSLAKK